MRKALRIKDYHSYGRRDGWRFERLSNGYSATMCQSEFSDYFQLPPEVHKAEMIFTTVNDPNYYRCKFDDDRELFLLRNDRTGEWEEVSATGSCDVLFRKVFARTPYFVPKGIGRPFYLGVEYA